MFDQHRRRLVVLPGAAPGPTRNEGGGSESANKRGDDPGGVHRDGVNLEGASHGGEPPPGGEPGHGRRDFLSLMATSLAMAGVEGCTRQPPEQIVPYVHQPEDVVPGRPQYYATSLAHGGYATGVLVRCETGRPIKVEGNPEHPDSCGATDAFSQAAVADLYNPERSQVVTRLGRITTWSRFAGELAGLVAAQRGSGGAGIRILGGMSSSPTLADEIAAFRADFPAALWSRHEPVGRHHARAGAELSFGAPLEVRHDLFRADVILAIESDFLAQGPGSLRYARDFSRRRVRGDTGALGHTSVARGELPPSPRMNRLYCVESSPTSTGTLADNLLTLRPSQVARFATALAVALGVVDAGARPPDLDPKLVRWAAAIARDLRERPGRTLITVGEPADPAVHALAMAMNDALGNVGTTVFYTDPVEASPVDHATSFRALENDMRSGRVGLLVILGGNPVYTAPADIDFAGAMASVPMCVHLSLYHDETSRHCQYHIPEAHPFEAWGDARAFDGTVSLSQPLIEPLYGGKSALQLVAAMRGRPAATGLEMVQAASLARLGAAATEVDFRRALELGLIPGTAFPPRAAVLFPGTAATAAARIAGATGGEGQYELAIRPDPTLWDGRFADNAWLQELPKPHTKLTWDNAALLGPRTAAALVLSTGDVVQLAREGRVVTAPVYVLPGHPDDTVTVHLGHGRTVATDVARDRGFDAYRLRTSAALWHVRGILIRKTDLRQPLAMTQSHFSPEGRPHVRGASLEELRADPEIIQKIGETPPRSLSLYPPWPYPGRAWGMTIDMGACTGCSACVVACDIENNVPVVGRDQVVAGRVMHWLRIDRYEIGPEAAPTLFNQPMMCVHCENAPCEYVCPVEATTHSSEGINEMTYNRCVGTRYCQNNCPYKVRRFNFFEWNDERADSRSLQRNPDVTVRSRGVMEKCTYCVQRINGARITAEREHRRVVDGEVVTACQQACPTGAILFGDLNDPAARVRQLKADPRSYDVLGELNTHPRTSHLARIWNRNPELEGHG